MKKWKEARRQDIIKSRYRSRKKVGIRKRKNNIEKRRKTEQERTSTEIGRTTERMKR